MLSTIHSATIIGLEAHAVDVEVDVSASGLPYTTIVGLPNKAVQESKERVRAALHNAGMKVKARKVTINLAPASLPKQGPAFDLPIALGLLQSHNLIPPLTKKILIVGELSLDGQLKYLPGSIAFALLAKHQGFESCILPASCALELQCIQGIKIYSAKSLQEVIYHLTHKKYITPLSHSSPQINISPETFPYIQGQETAKRAALITAAGGHHLLLKGNPGIGKTLLAKYLWHLLPSPIEQEMIDILNISSTTQFSLEKRYLRPFRSPHHTITHQKLLGGGLLPKPGEVTLAHQGILFLDEFGEFQRNTLESLRQPLDHRVVSFTYEKHQFIYPAKFQLVAAMNPCSCGYKGSINKNCRCSAYEIARYEKKLSGPLADRIDLHVNMKQEQLVSTQAEDQETVYKTQKQQVQAARDLQRHRYENTNITTNAELDNTMIQQYCVMKKEAELLLQVASQKIGFSPRRYHIMIRVAQTIADLGGHKRIEKQDVAEAIQVCRH